jgi:tol-pal system protein YbgF
MIRTLAAVIPLALLVGLPANAGAEQLDPVKTAQMRGQKAAPKAEATGQDASLRSRVEQLEEQLVDLQVVIGTLESLARPAASNAGGQYGGPGGGARVDGLETQIKALTAQMESLAQQVQSLGGRVQVGEAAATPVAAPPRPTMTSALNPPATAPMAAPATTQAAPPTHTQLPPPAMTQLPPPATAQLPPPAAVPTEARFGSTTVTSATADPIGGLIASDRQGGGNPGANANAHYTGGNIPAGNTAPAGQEMAAVTPPPQAAPNGFGESDVNPKQLYETAYGYLLQQDYGAAEASFNDFLTRFPNDSLAGNAQYWLGESFFVRGQYKQAASAFLKGYQTYAQSAKAPDSLLKLAMSLDRLGQKEAACSSFSELNSRFPTAPPHIKNRAQTERQRIGCT